MGIEIDGEVVEAVYYEHDCGFIYATYTGVLPETCPHCNKTTKE